MAALKKAHKQRRHGHAAVKPKNCIILIKQCVASEEDMYCLHSRHRAVPEEDHVSFPRRIMRRFHRQCVVPNTDNVSLPTKTVCRYQRRQRVVSKEDHVSIPKRTTCLFQKGLGVKMKFCHFQRGLTVQKVFTNAKQTYHTKNFVPYNVQELGRGMAQAQSRRTIKRIL